MSSKLAISDYVVIGIMLAVSAGIGLYFRFTGGRQKTTQEFLMADKNMGVLPVTFSLMATTLSAIALLGSPAEAYFYGTEIIMMDIFFSVGVVIAAFCFVPVFFHSESNTIYEYLEKRFGKVIKIVTSLLYSLQMILYMPLVLYAPSLALSTVTGFSVWTCVIIMALVCTFYSTLGGLKAVLWTDSFQATLMLFTNFIMIIKGSLDFGGISKVIETAKKGNRLDIITTNIDPTIRYTLWNCMAQGIVSGLFCYGATFTLIQRLTSCGTFKKAQRSVLWSIPLCFLFKASAVFVGTVIYAYFHDCDPIQDQTVKITSGDQLVPHFMLIVFDRLPGLPGLCIAGILSAALSTMSSIVNSLAAMTIEDYIKPYANCKSFSDSSATILAKILAISYGGLCVILTFVLANVKGVVEASLVLVGMIGGPSIGVFSLGMFTTTANEMGSLIGLFAGFIVNAWVGFGSLYNATKYPSLPLSTEGCAAHINSSFTETTSIVNSSTSFGFANLTLASDQNIPIERSVFPLYKVSYMWFATFGFVTTVTTGYIASLIAGLCTEKKHVNPLQLSPVVRKWLSGTPETSTNKECILLSHITNKVFVGRKISLLEFGSTKEEKNTAVRKLISASVGVSCRSFQTKQIFHSSDFEIISLEQRAKVNFCVLLKISPSGMLEVLKKA